MCIAECEVSTKVDWVVFLLIQYISTCIRDYIKPSVFNIACSIVMWTRPRAWSPRQGHKLPQEAIPVLLKQSTGVLCCRCYDKREPLYIIKERLKFKFNRTFSKKYTLIKENVFDSSHTQDQGLMVRIPRPLMVKAKVVKCSVWIMLLFIVKACRNNKLMVFNVSWSNLLCCCLVHWSLVIMPLDRAWIWL